MISSEIPCSLILLYWKSLDAVHTPSVPYSLLNAKNFLGHELPGLPSAIFWNLSISLDEFRKELNGTPKGEILLKYKLISNTLIKY